MAAVSRFEISTVKDPFTESYMGMAVGVHRDGTPLTLWTTDESGEFLTYPTAGEAYAAAQTLMFGLMTFRFRPASDITPAALGKATMDYLNHKPKDSGNLA